jgi:hypothetical protein
VDQPLAYLDDQLAHYTDELGAVGVAGLDVPSRIYEEICALPEEALNRIRVQSKLTPERFRDELSSFQSFEEIVFADGPENVPSAVSRARMIVLLHLSFVMLRDSLLRSVRQEAPADSTTRIAFDYLAGGDLWS